MFDVKDDAKGDYRRVEVLTGPGRRRRWSAEEKARIVAETLVPGANVSAVARRFQVCPQQVFGWRHAVRGAAPVRPRQMANGLRPVFVPIVAEPPARESVAALPPVVIEITLAGAAVRVVSGVDEAVLAAVCRASRLGILSMISLPAGTRVLVAARPVDFRKGAHALAALAAEALGADPFSGAVIIFRAKRGDRLKILVWDTSGLVLIWKQLQQGGFRWPPIMGGAMRLSPVEFAALFDGLDWTRVQTTKGIPKPVVAA